MNYDAPPGILKSLRDPVDHFGKLKEIKAQLLASGYKKATVTEYQCRCADGSTVKIDTAEGGLRHLSKGSIVVPFNGSYICFSCGLDILEWVRKD